MKTNIVRAFFIVDFDLSEEETCRATIRMFVECNLVSQFHIPKSVSIIKKKEEVNTVFAPTAAISKNTTITTANVYL